MDFTYTAQCTEAISFTRKPTLFCSGYLISMQPNIQNKMHVVLSIQAFIHLYAPKCHFCYDAHSAAWTLRNMEWYHNTLYWSSFCKILSFSQQWLWNLFSVLGCDSVFIDFRRNLLPPSLVQMGKPRVETNVDVGGRRAALSAHKEPLVSVPLSWFRRARSGSRI
jgi:hypothetical protein